MSTFVFPARTTTAEIELGTTLQPKFGPDAQLVKELRVDCDQDVILLKVENVGGAACHNGYPSCFYRKLAGGANLADAASLKLELTARRVFDPATVYKKK